MKRILNILLVIYILLYCGYAYSDSKDKPRIAVMDLEAKGVVQEESEAVSDFLRTDLLNTEKFTVIERSRLQDILNEQQFSLSGLTESEKVAKIGKLLNCKFILVGTLSKLGSQYFLNVRLVDVETGETKFGKRESSYTLEELSEVSKVIAAQLAGIKVEYKPKGKPSTVRRFTAEQEPKIEYTSPPLGFDVQFGLGLKNSRIYSYSITYNYSSDVLEYKEEGSPDSWNFRAGAYISLAYFGLLIKSYEYKQGDALDITINSNSESRTFSGTAANFTAVIKDLMIGIRFSEPPELIFGMLYFSWRSLKYDNKSTAVTSYYSGWCFGVGGKDGTPASPVSIFTPWDVHVAYLKYKPTSTLTNEIPYTLNIGGEVGLGVLFNRVGLYILADYNIEAFVRDQTITSGTSSYLETVLDIIHGSEVRVGWTFDLQALFH